MIIDELISYIEPEAGDQVVKDIRIGLGYTCVELSGGGCGLAYTFRRDTGHTCSVLGTAGTLLRHAGGGNVDGLSRIIGLGPLWGLPRSTP